MDDASRAPVRELGNEMPKRQPCRTAGVYGVRPCEGEQAETASFSRKSERLVSELEHVPFVKPKQRAFQRKVRGLTLYSLTGSLRSMKRSVTELNATLWLTGSLTGSLHNLSACMQRSVTELHAGHFFIISSIIFIYLFILYYIYFIPLIVIH